MSLKISVDHSGNINSFPSAKEKGSSANICFKIFMIVVIILATVIVITGSLSLMAAKGGFASIPAISRLSNIGEMNSYLMIASGVALFILGIAAWGCHLKKEKDATHPSHQV